MADPTRSPDHQFDWRADVRARIAGVDLDPEDERALIEEIAQHLEAQFEDLVPSIGVREARERLLAQLRDDRFEQLPGSVRRTHRPRARGAVWGAGSIWRVPQGTWGDAAGTRVALEAHAGRPLAELDLSGRTTFLLGAERAGLPAEVERDVEAWIPITGAESLNVAASGAIALYEWQRQTA